ncbi:MAG: hypothetical protein GY751_10735 [Bacteroidetes bacterium]|nr:hypothetical protein [Bacteroidota bacterium]
MGDLIPRNGELFREGDPQGWIYEESIASGENGTSVKIPPCGQGGMSVSVQVICAGGTGKVQTTFDSETAIDEDTALWDDWDGGDVTGTVSDSLISAVTGIRGVSVDGAITFKIAI